MRIDFDAVGLRQRDDMACRTNAPARAQVGLSDIDRVSTEKFAESEKRVFVFAAGDGRAQLGAQFAVALNDRVRMRTWPARSEALKPASPGVGHPAA